MIDGIPVDGPVDAVLHLASPASPPEYLAHPIATLEVGSVGTRHALDLARGERRALPARVDERDLRRPARAPATGELLRQRQQRRSARRCTTRPSATPRRSRWRTTASSASTPRSCASSTRTGPGCGPADGRVVSNFLAQAMRGEPLTVYGDGKQTRSFCFVSDEVEGLPRAARVRPRRPDEHRQPERVHHARAGRARARGHRRARATSCSSRCRPTIPSSADPTSRSPSACSAGIPASTSAKVSPARTTGTGGSVSPDEIARLPQAVGDRPRVRRAQHRGGDRAPHAHRRAARRPRDRDRRRRQHRRHPRRAAPARRQHRARRSRTT